MFVYVCEHTPPHTHITTCNNNNQRKMGYQLESRKYWRSSREGNLKEIGGKRRK